MKLPACAASRCENQEFSMSISFEIDLSEAENKSLEELARASGKTINEIVSEIIRSALPGRRDQLLRISEEIMNEKSELYRRLAT
jgi:hypothetical protein